MTQIAWPPSGGIHIHLNLAPPTMPVPAQGDDAQLQRMHDRLLAQIVRINDWCAEHAPDEYHSDGDTADAIIAVADRLRGQVTRLTQDYHDINAQLVAVLADNATLANEVRILRSYAVAAPHGNGKSSVAATLDRLQPPTDLPEQYPPAIAATVEATQAAPAVVKPALNADGDPELSDYLIGLEANRHTWRTIPKPVRWRLVQAHLRSIWRDGHLPSMADFDASRPAWMPSATAVAMTFGDGKWSVVCGKAVEP